MVEGTMALGSFAAAAQRAVPRDIQLISRLHLDYFDDLYKELERDKKLVDVKMGLQMEDAPFWYMDFLEVAGDMHKQYLSIRKARKELFDCDRPGIDHGCELDIEAWRRDERIASLGKSLIWDLRLIDSVDCGSIEIMELTCIWVHSQYTGSGFHISSSGSAYILEQNAE